MIYYVKGDLFQNVKSVSTDVIIPHVCNNIGAWGSGFVLPLAKNYPEAKEAYLKWYKGENWIGSSEFAIGNTQIVAVDPGVFVANMVAQDGITKGSMGDRSRVVDRPLRYDSLVKCMIEVAEFALAIYPRMVIHCPKFGSGLAGGDWNFIEYLIEDIWNKSDIDTVIYTYGI